MTPLETHKRREGVETLWLSHSVIFFNDDDNEIILLAPLFFMTITRW